MFYQQVGNFMAVFSCHRLSKMEPWSWKLTTKPPQKHVTGSEAAHNSILLTGPKNLISTILHLWNEPSRSILKEWHGQSQRASNGCNNKPGKVGLQSLKSILSFHRGMTSKISGMHNNSLLQEDTDNWFFASSWQRYLTWETVFNSLTFCAMEIAVFSLFSLMPPERTWNEILKKRPPE